MRELLELVVSEGGAKNAAIEGYRIGGKTGTAQVYKDGRIVRDVHIGSFLGFAPADDPRIALLVIVDEADVPVDYGGTTAAPFARQILADVLPYLGYKPTTQDEREEIAVEDVVGMPLWQARKVIADQGFRVLDDGAGRDRDRPDAQRRRKADRGRAGDALHLYRRPARDGGAGLRAGCGGTLHCPGGVASQATGAGHDH